MNWFDSSRTFRLALVRLPKEYEVRNRPKSVCHVGSHCWTNTQGTMNLDEIVGKVIQSDRSGMIPQFPRKTVRKSGVAPQVGPKRPILAFNKTSADLTFIGIAGDHSRLNSDALGWAVSFFVLLAARSAVNLLKNCEIYIAAESVLDGFKVGPVPIGCDLDAIGEPRSEIADERFGGREISRSEHPRWHQFGFCVDGDPKPNIACIGILLRNLLSAVLFFAINPSPNLVELESSALQITEDATLKILAKFPDFNQDSHHCLLCDARHPDGRSYRGTFNQATNHLSPCFRREAIHNVQFY